MQNDQHHCIGCFEKGRFVVSLDLINDTYYGDDYNESVFLGWDTLLIKNVQGGYKEFEHFIQQHKDMFSIVDHIDNNTFIITIRLKCKVPTEIKINAIPKVIGTGLSETTIGKCPVGSNWYHFARKQDHDTFASIVENITSRLPHSQVYYIVGFYPKFQYIFYPNARQAEQLLIDNDGTRNRERKK